MSEPSQAPHLGFRGFWRVFHIRREPQRGHSSGSIRAELREKRGGRGFPASPVKLHCTIPEAGGCAAAVDGFYVSDFRADKVALKNVRNS
jgi:hypothetical protein